MNSDVGRGAERAIGVIGAAVVVGVRDLNGAQSDDQKDAEQRKEDSPGMAGAISPICETHISQIF